MNNWSVYTHLKQGNRKEDDRWLLLKILAFLCQAGGNRYVTEIPNFSLSVVQIFIQRNYGDIFVFQD